MSFDKTIADLTDAILKLRDQVGYLRHSLEEAGVVAKARSYPRHQELGQGVLGRGEKRRGRIENHVLAIAKTFADQADVSLTEFTEVAIATLPEPEPGKRDTRRQVVARALQTLSREKDGPLAVSGGRVILFD